VAYFNDFARDWFKLDDLDFGEGRFRPSSVFDNPEDFAGVLDVLRGDADSIDDALQLRHNNRTYESWGVQTVIGMGFNTGSAKHDLEIGLRWHQDEEDRLQNRENFKIQDGALILTSVDPLGSQGNRVGKAQAFAAFVQDEIEIGRWTLLPGVRFEKIKLERIDYSSTDPDRSEGATGMRENHVDAVIPGFGATFKATDELTLLAGIHRGFAPPGTSTRDGQASVEKSWSYELGLRYMHEWMYVEVIGFYNDYSNILGTCANSTGCTGEIGDQFNGGTAIVKGVEATVSYDIVASNSDEMPYIAKHQLHASIGLEATNWGANLGMTYVSDIRTETGQGAIPVIERIDSHVVFDLSAYYQVNDKVRLYATAENLFDADYAVARRPYGLRPGKPFTVVGGVSFNF